MSQRWTERKHVVTVECGPVSFRPGQGRGLGEPQRAAFDPAWASEMDSFLEGVIFHK